MDSEKRRIFRIVIIIFSFLLLIFISAKIFQKLEGWSFLDAIYFTVITFTTIGYGDLTPQTAAGKIFTMVFSFMGIVIVFYIVSLIGSHIFKKRINQKVDQIKQAAKEQESVNKKSKS